MGHPNKSKLQILEEEATAMMIKSAREDDFLIVNYLHSGNERSNTCTPQKNSESIKSKKNE
jgi:hypothetical protein